MIELLSHDPTTYFERIDGNLVFGNSRPLVEKGTIELVIGTERFLIPINDQGFWHWEAPTLYADGNYTLSVRHIDLAGNSSVPTLAVVVIDSTPPEAPELIKLYDDQGSVTGSFDVGQTTDDKRPTLTGIAQKGAIVYLLNEKDEKIGSVIADKTTGKWVMEPSRDLAEGNNNLRLVAEETFAGQLRTSTPSDSFSVIVMAGTLPTIPVIIDAIDDVGTVTGSIANGGVSDDRQLTLRGTGDVGDKIIIRYSRTDGSYQNLAEVTVKANGSWEYTTPALNEDGAWYFTAAAQNSFGTSDVAKFHYTIDANVDAQLSIDYAFDSFGLSTGNLLDGGTTDDSTPTLNGNGPAGSLVYIRTLLGANEKIYSVKAGDNGKWSWTPPSALANGDWDFQVSESVKGNWGEIFDLKIAQPSGVSEPTVLRYYDNVGTNQGWKKLIGSSVTNDSTPTFEGTSLPNSSFYITHRIASNELVTHLVTTNSAGVWSYTPEPLQDWGSQKGSSIFYWNHTGNSGSGILLMTITHSSTAPELQTPWTEITSNDEVPSLNNPHQTLDLNVNSKELSELKLINLTELDNNTLKLDLTALLQHGEKDLYIEDGITQLMMKGNEGDVVELKDIQSEGNNIREWKHQEGTVTVAGVEYNVYSHGDDAELLVQQGVKIEMI